MAAIPRTPGVINRYKRLSGIVQDYFSYFEELANGYPWEVTIGYLFTYVELAQNMTIYCGVVKLHRVESRLARRAVEAYHMTRPGFRDTYRVVFGQPIPQKLIAKIKEAEGVRDKIVHGKSVSDQNMRKAVIDILDYAEALNEEVYDFAKFRPFGPLRGFKGRAAPLDVATSRWVLKGMGFDLS